MPLCEALAIKCREQSGSGKEVLIATMTVGYELIRESFTTEVALDNASRDHLVEYLDGPFAHLENRWHFTPFAEAACEVDRSISPTASARGCSSGWLGGLFAKAVHKYTEAFEARADAVYGREDASALASQQ